MILNIIICKYSHYFNIIQYDSEALFHHPVANGSGFGGEVDAEFENLAAGGAITGGIASGTDLLYGIPGRGGIHLEFNNINRIVQHHDGIRPAFAILNFSIYLDIHKREHRVRGTAR